MPHYTIDTTGRLDDHLQQEWLLSNGLGGFASSTIVGCNTRRYHGLLCAATTPPVGRYLALNRIGEILFFDGDRSRMLELSINQFDDEFHPRGDQYLRRFELLDDIVRFHFEVENIHVLKEVQISWLRNVVAVRYTIKPGQSGRDVKLHLLPFVSLRDFHSLRRKAAFSISADAQDVVVADGKLELHLRADRGRFIEQGDWWYGHTYAVEVERGLDHVEDLFAPGRFEIDVKGQTVVTFWAGLERSLEYDWEGERQRRREAVSAAARAPENLPATHIRPTLHDHASRDLRRLARAANDFVVFRKSPDGTSGASIIAGYPWFSDWGRDTMISLPGLLLATGRLQQAREVLCVFAQYVSEGMIPNCFDDYTNEPHYNTVDASLWFIQAVHEYLRYSDDHHTFNTKLLPACEQIIAGYRSGTRFNIRMDESDGLISQGDASTQLTWMDAKCEGIAFTPRQGKPVEINALWHHALVLMRQEELASRVAESFRRVFWISPFRGLADVVDGDRRDASLRPNQIFAVSLPNSPLSEDQQHAVVEAVRRELLTPYGLRTLARGERNYIGRYTGPPMQRDRAYHNGTVWPWLMGAFLDAHLKVHRRSHQAVEQARRWLRPLMDHLEHQGCIGQISEVFDGDAPHRPGGCCAQAWSVAEILRLAVQLHEPA